LAGSPGEAEGEIFTVLSADDFAKFPKGAVLLARTTNPTWTPLFYSAAAVITESGGPLSHGAVTAREMRIPAVMSVRESLTRLKNAQRVRVDGTRGKVFLL
jgi:pyruvate,water dikinase